MMENMDLFKKKLKICFVLPGYTRQAIGGFRIVYEYANRLSDRGYEIYIICINKDIMEQFWIPSKIKNIIANYLTHRGPKWFSINNNVKLLSATNKKDFQSLKEIDIVIATAVNTVKYVQDNIKCSKRLYLIQGFENWKYGNEYCYKTYQAGFQNIVISKWLKDIVDEYSLQPSVLIKNPIDLNNYKVVVPQSKRKLHTIGLLYHSMESKGVKYSIEAIQILKRIYVDLEVYMFGVPSKPRNLSWVHYIKEATQEQTVEIYNKVTVWMCASIDEGYGLTGLEAMACGAVLISTQYTGVLEYAKNEYNALLSPIKDVNALVTNTCRVFNDSGLRQCLIDNALQTVKSFEWDIAVNKMENIISNL